MDLIHIIGIGSPYGDDQLGWKVIDRLKTTSFINNNSIHLSYCETPATDLLQYLKQADFVILIDAIHAELPVGQICSWSQLSLLPETSISSHGMSLGMLLKLAETLEQLPTHWLVCGIVIDCEQLDLNAELSPVVTQSIPQLLEHIQVCVQTHLG